MTEIATEGDLDRLQIEIATVAGVEGGRGTEVEGTPGARGPHRDHHPQVSTKTFCPIDGSFLSCCTFYTPRYEKVQFDKNDRSVKVPMVFQ